MMPLPGRAAPGALLGTFPRRQGGGRGPGGQVRDRGGRVRSGAGQGEGAGGPEGRGAAVLTGRAPPRSRGPTSCALGNERAGRRRRRRP